MIDSAQLIEETNVIDDENTVAATGSWHTAYRTAPALMFCTSQDGRLVDLSNLFAKRLGYRRDEVIGRPLSDFMTIESQQTSRDIVYSDLRQTGLSLGSRQVCVTKDKEVVEVELTASISDGPGELQYIGVLSDVTELTRQFAELIEKHQLYNEVLTFVPDMLLRARPDGTIVYANKSYCDHHGVPEYEIKGTNCFDLVEPEIAKAIRERIKRITRESPVITEYQKDGVRNGRRRWLAWSDRGVFDFDGTLVDIFSVGRDVTEKVELEARFTEQNNHLMRIGSELAEANEGLRQFTLMATHDLQAPLRRLVSFTSMLTVAVKEGNQADLFFALDVINETATKASGLLTDVIRFFSAAERTIERDEVSVPHIISSITSTLTEAFREAGGTIMADIDDQLTVSADAVQLTQIFKNLFDNALKYRSPDRPLQVAVVNRPLAEGGLSIDISDNGIGFEKTDAERIFEPFRRLSQSVATPGSGIGLAICWTAAKRMGWTIEVNSKPGVGSRFSISIPAHDVISPNF